MRTLALERERRGGGGGKFHSGLGRSCVYILDFCKFMCLYDYVLVMFVE